MPRLLTLSRAARLVGVRRGVLQSKIRSGDLPAFEGMVSADDLLRAYPEVRLDDGAVLERMEAIKETAFTQRMRERLLPSSEVLAARVAELGRERVEVEARLEHYRAIVGELVAKLHDPVELLFGVQLGGGTDIANALAYCQQIIERPRSSGAWAAKVAGSAAGSVPRRWFGTRSAVSANQKRESPVRTRPLSVIGVGRTTSNAESLSEATRSSRPSPRS